MLGTHCEGTQRCVPVSSGGCEAWGQYQDCLWGGGGGWRGRSDFWRSLDRKRRASRRASAPTRPPPRLTGIHCYVPLHGARKTPVPPPPPPHPGQSINPSGRRRDTGGAPVRDGGSHRAGWRQRRSGTGVCGPRRYQRRCQASLLRARLATGPDASMDRGVPESAPVANSIPAGIIQLGG
eukprot:gene15165-biopygen17158